MTNFYEQYPRFFVSVDCIIFGYSEGCIKLLIHKRPYNPGKGEMSLIGGFVRSGENLDDAASRVLMEFTGLRQKVQQMETFGDVNRDPGERVISVVYYSLINVKQFDSDCAMHEAEWVDLNNMPNLCFDHNQMVFKAIKKVRERLFTEPLGANLLQPLFTLTQLQMVYEAILGHPIDKRNFRRTIADHDFFEKTEFVDKSGSRRGAALYKQKVFSPQHGDEK